MQLTGIHHLTAISADASGNHDFYTRLMGMRLVKKTVNQDDVSAYHLFYADGRGTPGTDLTFFDWPAPKERRGTNSVVRTALRVSGAQATFRIRMDACNSRSRIRRASGWRSSTMVARGPGIRGRGARFRCPARSAVSVR
jgi:catechol 2,3-dioxygenase-like lactoylglutathione lyase family enzyme